MKAVSFILILIMLCMPVEAQSVDRQFRAMWISTVLNIDFPKTDGEVSQKEEIITLLDRAGELNMNAVMFQIRACADGFYRSELVPVSKYLGSGDTLTYDPLEFIIEEAHKRGLELHAWMNPYRVSMYTDEELPENSVYYTHPEWIKTAKDRFVIDPGIPEARRHVEDCVMEVAENYNIDGIHFDDYFYYESEESPLADDDTFALYGEGFEDKGDWRRNNTYLLIKELSEKLRNTRPDIKFGISPAGVWRNIKDDPEGSKTYAGLPNYDRAFADTRRWVREGLIDYIAPQIYWSFETEAAPYKTVADWWINETKNTDVQLYIGQALYRADEFGIDEIIRQNEYNISNEIAGSIMFSASQTSDYYDELCGMWDKKTLLPEYRGKDIPRPRSPYVTYANGILRINDSDENTKYFCVFGKSGNLIKTVYKSGRITEITGHPEHTVAAANANHLLSAPAEIKNKSIAFAKKIALCFFKK